MSSPTVRISIFSFLQGFGKYWPTPSSIYRLLVFSPFLVWIQSINLTIQVHSILELREDTHKITGDSWSFSSFFAFSLHLLYFDFPVLQKACSEKQLSNLHSKIKLIQTKKTVSQTEWPRGPPSQFDGMVGMDE